MDKLCQLEMDGIKQNYENRIGSMQNDIDSLRAAINSANGVASALERYLAPTPMPAYIVSNPNCCGQNNFGYGYGYNVA